MPDDAAQIASELSGLLKAGAADPLSLLAGEWRFHACFIAPFTPGFAEARRQFLVDGGGPLSAMVEQLRHQGLSAGEAAETARKMMESATGLCVAVVAGDHGVASIPQPFFGHLSPEWRHGAAQVLAESYRGPFAAALAAMEAQAENTWPRLVTGPAVRSGDLAGFWLELAHGVAEAGELAGLRDDARQADLGHWTAEAVALLAAPGDLDAQDHAALSRCHLVAGEILPAATELAACAAAGGETEAIELIDALASLACRNGGSPELAAWLADPPPSLSDYAYDLALARVRVLAAIGSEAVALRPAVAALVTANRKLARQALTREPLWQVTAPDPGELLDTATAAEILGRSPTAIAKRIEARTMPVHDADGQVRIPRRALEAWQSVLGELGLLDS